ncbi:hypothetical protein [Tessaracoccus defluvii]|uniref:hypothetical protein n=1 Tax=Tessaracoccus defluvii TaxID=1285901 RepID=UPI001D03F794|nr:hypothetical protein [Tessaracoccus defluvii]
MGADLLSAGGILAAFLAGGVALFAPCCIVFLAPSYLAAAAKNRRWRLIPLTFVFAAGLALVLVPITMGVSLIAGAIAKYHVVLYWAGGLLMIGLGLLALSGRCGPCRRSSAPPIPPAVTPPPSSASACSPASPPAAAHPSSPG